MERIIFHIDMNSYFASCEQQANPFLRGKPIGVCEHLGGIIIAPSIEAKKRGVKTAMPVWEAKKLCPEIFLMPTDPDKYRQITENFIKVFYQHTDLVDQYSIDEAFLDLTGFAKSWKEAEQVAWQIKSKIKLFAGDWIKCSIGISGSKLLAKIASDLQKPDGLVVINPDEKDFLYQKLKLTDLPGIARRTEKNLNALGIFTLIQLRDYQLQNLISHFGLMGHHLHSLGQLQGSWQEEFDSGGAEVEGENIKSMGHMYTLPRGKHTQVVAEQVLYKLSEMVARRLRFGRKAGSVISVQVGGPEWELSTQHNIGFVTQDGKEIFEVARKLVFGNGGIRNSRQKKFYRFVGVTVSNLIYQSSGAGSQLMIFQDNLKNGRLIEQLDKINDKYGEFTVARTPVWQARTYIRDSIGFGRIKESKIKFKPAKQR